MWGCRACDFDVCGACRQQPERDSPPFDVGSAAGRKLLSLIQSSGAIAQNKDEEHVQPAPSAAETDEADTLDDLTSNEEWTGFYEYDPACQGKTPWYWEHSGDEFPKEHTSPYSMGDETLLGLDGELYDVFYPPDSSPEEVISPTSCDTQSTAGLIMARRTSAEAKLGDVVAHMRSVTAERYPARTLLFERVHAAVKLALGTHFDRFVLVGSTALRIDTPDSDLDAVAYTRSIVDEATGVVSAAPSPRDTLREIAGKLAEQDKSLQLQLVDCTRVPVLTVLTVQGELSLDLTVDEPLGEYHVYWFQSLRPLSHAEPAPLHHVPLPFSGEWEKGLEAQALRCVKWWLRRRGIPTSKEGGYPTVVWTIMVLHVLHCSLFVNDATDATSRQGRALLGAIAAFFDRFADSGLVGTLFFEGRDAKFLPQSSAAMDAGSGPFWSTAELSVLDPTTTGEGCAEFGIEPTDLAPPMSAATRLLHLHELRRAQRLSATALTQMRRGGGGDAVQELFTEIDESLKMLPSVLPAELQGVMALQGGENLVFGLLRRIQPKPGWSAPFLHRRDAQSLFALQPFDIKTKTRTATLRGGAGSLRWFHPCDFVCLVAVDYAIPQQDTTIRLRGEAIARWRGMRDLLGCNKCRHS